MDDDRRKYERVYVHKHVNGHDWGIELDGHYYMARLLDVGRGGARLQIDECPEYDLSGKTGSVK